MFKVWGWVLKLELSLGFKIELAYIKNVRSPTACVTNSHVFYAIAQPTALLP